MPKPSSAARKFYRATVGVHSLPFTHIAVQHTHRLPSKHLRSTYAFIPFPHTTNSLSCTGTLYIPHICTPLPTTYTRLTIHTHTHLHTCCLHVHAEHARTPFLFGLNSGCYAEPLPSPAVLPFSAPRLIRLGTRIIFYAYRLPLARHSLPPLRRLMDVLPFRAVSGSFRVLFATCRRVVLLLTPYCDA